MGASQVESENRASELGKRGEQVAETAVRPHCFTRGRRDAQADRGSDSYLSGTHDDYCKSDRFTVGFIHLCNVTLMTSVILLVTEPPSPNPRACWEVGLIVMAFLGSFAAIVTMFISLVSLKPHLREWREALIGRMTAWRWASPRMQRFMRREATLVDRVGTRAVFR